MSSFICPETKEPFLFDLFYDETEVSKCITCSEELDLNLTEAAWVRLTIFEPNLLWKLGDS